MSAPAAEITSALPVPRRLPRLSGGTLVAVVALVFAILVPLIWGTFASFVGARIATTAIIGLSVTVVTGYTGQLSLMPYTFVGIGVFTSAHAITAWGWPFWFAALLAAAATLPLSLLVGLVSVRLRGFYFAIATLTFASAMGETLFDWEAFTGGQRGMFIERPEIFGASLVGDRAFYWLCLAAVLAVVWTVLGLQRSRIGRAMATVRENETEAQTLGVNVMKVKLVAFVISGIIAAIGGVFHGMLLQQVTPTPYQTPHVEFLSVTLIILVVVGGMRSAWGPFLGAGIIFVQLEVFRTALFLQYFIAAASALAFVVILLVVPGGLVDIVRHEAHRIKEDPLKQGLRVFLLVAAQVAFFYIIWRIST
ncbi:MAG: branched-chain amino acid ABC transporter permease [Actinobacteria bacterium]|nr:branched-chain amino acid ABC transporter permease [Actinomycetota bacterium]